ncbi:MFS transporter [Mucilaginibacter myungsuensis]|uniref:MFS transporter n=1 Tax=Mucilaginibacter myungsuensis TaxID=649104 RepID=A0A929PU71_9SPHI|nr:MFS transporter [Mucilaginibacter myungsuensis]MBE9660438.1 MFS transporter [Mucilaginibacter myungsuensis]MDN3600480.1 MFS transporter [Mucilaginibacter myungsuensis]
MQPSNTTNTFTGYQKVVILLLALTQFTVILDFMVMSPLGDMLMKSMSLKPSAFSLAVSAYAISAGISGLLAAGFADKFDRKKLLMFFYIGFIVGTILCGIAHTYAFLVAARIFTGIFGGVIGSISMAIVTDIFAMQQRGRVMGFMQMGFGGSQVLGVPIGLALANKWGWEAPFWLVAAISVIIAVAIAIKIRPVNEHLKIQQDKSPFLHLLHTVSKRDYQIGFLCTAMLSIGGFMMMPFGSAFAINNLGISDAQLPLLFMASGTASLLFMPLIGKVSDKIDKFKIFLVASVWMAIMCVIYTNLGVTALPIVIVLNILMMTGMMSRMIPSSALTSAIPAMADRGAFMSINASLQQIAGGIAAIIAGMIVSQQGKGTPLEHYNTVGYVIVGITIVSIFMMNMVSKMVKNRQADKMVAENELMHIEA